MTLLSRRDYTVRDLSERLVQRGFEEAAAARVVVELLRDGVLDDGRYAQNYVAYHAGRGQGPLRIAAELRRSGLEAEVIDAALGAGPDWSALARKACRAKFGLQPPDSWTERARRARFLQYRGFSSDHIRAATGVEPDTGFSEP
ncbi:MAG TPA: regulatory protein RecX [Steroidobacteraceae bacterium]|jgi:regulatory protein